MCFRGPRARGFGVHGHGSRLVHDPRSHLYQAMSMPQELTLIPILQALGMHIRGTRPLPGAIAATVAHPDGQSSVCALAWLGSALGPQSTTRNPARLTIV